MNIISFLLFLIWLACGVLVYRFVRRTGGFSEVGKVAHWFGGFFTIIGLAFGLVWIYAVTNANFGTKANVYMVTHQLRPGVTIPLIQHHQQNDAVTVYRRGSVNTTARLEGTQLVIDERQTVHTSFWWMLWDTKFHQG